MNQYHNQIIATAIIIVSMLVFSQFYKQLVKKVIRRKSMDLNRRKVILNVSYLFFYFITMIMLTVAWGIELKDFILFISSILAVLGVGFFAQWSILSNLTSSVLLFFNHPVRIGDRVRIVDKDYNWIGRVTDISGFFLYMTLDSGEKISLPTTFVLQKPIEMVGEDLSPQIENEPTSNETE